MIDENDAPARAPAVVALATDRPQPAAAPSPESARLALKRLATAAWLAILLGFAMQGLVLAAKIAAGSVPTAAQVLVDLAQGVTWSFFVCAGVALGTAIAKARASIGGFIGMLSAPLAMGLAKGGQKAMAGAIGVAGKPAVIPLLALGGVRAIEYGLLGWLLASLAARQEHRSWRYLSGGGAIGVVFGGGLTLWTIHASASALTAGQVAGTAINEIVFPIGCSLVVFIALQIGRHVKLVTEEAKT